MSERLLGGYNPSSSASFLGFAHARPLRIARSPTVVHIQNLIDDLKCFETVRDLRWPQGVTCPDWDSAPITKQGHDSTQPERQRSRCQACEKLFDDLTGTIFAGHHQPLRVWILCLYFMGLNLSNEQIGQELDFDPDDAQTMTTTLREGIVERQPVETLSGEVECKDSVNP
jgi:transposase-like protein